MTHDEFWKQYHAYQTTNKDEAIKEAAKVNEIGIDGDQAVVVYFGVLGWTLMSKSAADFLRAIEQNKKEQYASNVSARTSDQD